MISIIVPVYNVQDYIVKCLNSVASQTYVGAMECLIIDDCGQDDSIKLAEEFVETYQGTIDFRIIHHDHNRGLSAARNTGILESKGDWLYFLDSDDWITDDCILLFMQMVDRYPNTDIIFSGANVDSSICVWLDYNKKELDDFSNNRDWIQKTILMRYPLGMTAWNKMISKPFLHRHSLFFCEQLIHEDELWNFRLAQSVTSIAFIKHNTYFYNLRPNSIMAQIDEGLIWKRLMKLWFEMVKSIGPYNKQVQISGLCAFVFERSQFEYPKEYGFDMARLLFRLAQLSRYPYNFLLLVQSLLALLNHRKFFNIKIRKRLVLS